jgi:hypothetical protein
MNKHNLYIEVKETTNPNVLKVEDFSVYSDLLPVVCPELHITAPGMEYSTNVSEEKLHKGFTVLLTACDLGLQKTACDKELYEIPDGIYALKYMLKPHEYVFTEVYHLRATKALNRIYELYCCLKSNKNLQKKDESSLLKEINLLQTKIEVAKAKVSCGDIDHAMDIFNRVVKDIEVLKCKVC